MQLMPAELLAVVAAGIATGASLQAAAGAWLARRWVPSLGWLFGAGGAEALKTRLRNGAATLEHFAEAQETALTGSWEWDPGSGAVKCSPEFSRMCGAPPEACSVTYEEFLKRVYPDDRRRVQAVVEKSLGDAEPFSTYYRIERPDGTLVAVHGRGRTLPGPAGGAARVAGTAQDVSERKAAEKLLALQAEELERSNEELRQFAYVVSHDLQEPLRTVASFTQLLKKRYAGRLDGDADEIIAFASEGAAHMQALIEALRGYFRVDRRGVRSELVDSGAVVEEVISDLHTMIAEAGAEVLRGRLPAVRADPALMAELLQNLIANAVKYRGPRPPRIRVSAARAGGFWEFAVSDNGIGVEPRHHKRIFQIFQRLHAREAYPGTGIGLAICKKIVECHGGRIWIESAFGAGATIRFTLPCRDGAWPSLAAARPSGYHIRR